MQPLMNVIGNLGYVAVCVLGAALVMNGSIKFGVITAFILYVRLFTSPLTTIAQGMTQLQSAAAAGDRVFDFLQEPELPDESKNLPAPQPVRGEIEFDHVRFSYPDHPEKTIIHDFSAHVAPGQKIASSARPAPESQRWSICSCAFMIWTAATSASTAFPRRI